MGKKDGKNPCLVLMWRPGQVYRIKMQGRHGQALRAESYLGTQATKKGKVLFLGKTCEGNLEMKHASVFTMKKLRAKE